MNTVLFQSISIAALPGKNEMFVKIPLMLRWKILINHRDRKFLVRAAFLKTRIVICC